MPILPMEWVTNIPMYVPYSPMQDWMMMMMRKSLTESFRLQDVILSACYHR